tara:strand:- start:317 stop:637 length:321 start_codon:yes stop_codon:yes gene_type:complete
MTVHEMQKSNRVKKTKNQKAEDNERLLVAMQEQHDVLSSFCDDIWMYEWQVQRMAVEDYTKLLDARDEVCSAKRILGEELVADNYHNDETGEYDGVNVTLRSAYGK